MKQRSLKELNENGTLIFSFKRPCFIMYGKPYHYSYGRSSTCYLHYFNGLYVVTIHVIHDRQFVFDTFDQASRYYLKFIESQCS